MRKIALLGNAGGGKSTLAIRLSESKRIPLYSVDKLQWKPGGVAVPDEEFEKYHDPILSTDGWIIDGFGTYHTYLRRLEAADTIILIDHPMWRHYWWAAKRNFSSLFRLPVGIREDFPILRRTVKLAKFIWWVHQNFTPTNRQMIAKYAKTKRVFHLRSPRDIQAFCEEQSL